MIVTPIHITKADGTTEPFDESKLRASLQRVGASDEATEEILHEIGGELYDGISTSEIFTRAFAHLRDHRRGVAAKYSLKRAILDFGPSGFPFEAYMAELFRVEGYHAIIDQIVQGTCVEHEVDVVLTKGDVTTYVEAKFHNTAGFKTDLKTTLYVKARIDDLKAVAPKRHIRGLIVTNTKFTSKAVQYATCEGLDLLAWEYPREGNLHDRIDTAKLYPITALTTLTRREKTALLSQKIVLCAAIVTDKGILKQVGVTGQRAESVFDEAQALCASGKDI